MTSLLLLLLGLLTPSLERDVSLKQIYHGYSHSCALSQNGTIQCWGYNQFGQLGLGDTEPREMRYDLPFVDLGEDFVVEQIALGDFHSCVLSEERKIKCWGYNAYGQLGYGDKKNRGGKPNEMGDNLPFVDLGEDFVVERIILWPHDSCAVAKDDDRKCWGLNPLSMRTSSNT